ALCGARPLAGRARLLARNLDRGLGAGRGLLERDLEVVAEIGPALRAAAATASAEEIAEAEDVAEAAEDVLEADEDARIESRAAAARDAGVAESIVEAALLAIGEHRVRFGRFLERLLGLVVARVAVGVVLQRELAIGALDLLVRRRALDAEDFVVIPFRDAAHPLATF